MRRLRFPAAGLAAALSAILATSALSATPAPPPDAAPFPSVGTYEDRAFPAEELVTRGLACNVIASRLSCHDSQKQADAAGAAESVGALASCSPPLTVWMASGFTGASLNYYDYPGWQNLPTSWRNEVSSWRSGCRAGRLSDYVNGGGNSIGLPAGDTASTMPAGWDNRADAIYRY